MIAGDNAPMMRAVSQSELGGPEVLRVISLARPQAGIGEILVAVRAAGLNPTDLKNRAEVLTVDRLPLILGWDVSGVVKAVGFGVTLFKPGDEVFGMLPYPNGVGSHAEFVAGPARAFTHKPAAIDHVQAGALPLAALTAYQALIDTAGLRPGQRVLVHGAAGGMGHLAVQIAKSCGAYVIGTASPADHDFLRSLHADEVIDYHTTDFVRAAPNIDVVIDPVSGDTTLRSLEVLRPGGVLISVRGISPDVAARAAGRGVRAEGLVVESDQAGMKAVAALATSGALRARIGATLPLAQAAKAHALAEAGTAAGKVVLTVEPPAPSSASE